MHIGCEELFLSSLSCLNINRRCFNLIYYYGIAEFFLEEICWILGCFWIFLRIIHLQLIG